MKQRWQSTTSSCQPETQERLPLKHKDPLRTLIQFSHCCVYSRLQKRSVLKKLFCTDRLLYNDTVHSGYQNKLVIMPPTFSERATVIRPLCSSTVLVRGNDTFNYSGSWPLTFRWHIWWQNPSIARALMCNYTDVMSGSGTVYGFCSWFLQSCFILLFILRQGQADTPQLLL